MEENATVNTEPTIAEESTAADAETQENVTPPEDTGSNDSGIEEKNTDSDTEPTDTTPAAPFMSVRYNKETQELSQEEAVTLAQKGMLYEKKFEPIYSKLDYLATLNGVSVNELVESILNRSEDAYKQELIAKFGEDEEVISDLMEIYHNKNREKYEKAVSDRKNAEIKEQESLEARLADEFIILQKEFPEIDKFEDLPNEVKKAAAEGNNLLSSMLLHKHREDRKINEAQKAAKEANKASAGSVADKGEKESDAMNAFLKGLWN